MHHGGLLHRYASFATPIESRVEAFLRSEPRLTWVTLFLSDFPSADVSLAGGTLRDILLGRVPQDLDLIIHNLDQGKVERWLQTHGAVSDGHSLFAKFHFVPHGTALTSPIEIGMSKTVIDARGADFHACDTTVNSMSWRIRGRRLFDPDYGYIDLEQRVLRANGNPSLTLASEPMRILRILRQACELQFAIEAKTWAAIRQLAPLLTHTVLSEDGTHVYAVSRKRIGAEFLRGFLAHPVHLLTLWKEAGLLDLLLPELSDLSELIERDGESAWKKTLRALDLCFNTSLLHEHKKTAPSAEVLLATLFGFLPAHPERAVHRIGSRFHLNQFPKGHPLSLNGKRVISLLEQVHIFELEDPATMRPSHFEKRFCGELGEDLFFAMHVHELALGIHRSSRERLAIARRMQQELCERAKPYGGRLPKLISGRDLIPLGIPQGPGVRDILSRVRDAQIAHVISTKPEAITYIQMHLK